MVEDNWCRVALAEDRLVAEVLMQLRHGKEYSSSSSAAKILVDMSPWPVWGATQPRTRQIPRCSTLQENKEVKSTRASPTTPLSWSGGTSLSGGGTADCYEESSYLVNQKSVVRSKVIATGANNGKRSRRKKTPAELKEEENELLKERIQLKKELATLRTNFEEQRIRNVSLKKRKFQPVKEASANAGQKEGNCSVPHQAEAYSVDEFPSVLPKEVASVERDSAAIPSSVPDPCRIQKEDIDENRNFFALPDLNLPLDDDSNSDILYGIS